LQTSFSSVIVNDNDSTPKAKPIYNDQNNNKENNSNTIDNDLLKPDTRPSLHIDVSPRTARRMKGAGMMNPSDSTLLADMFRQFKEQSSNTTAVAPTSFFCEEMLSKTNATMDDDGEISFYDSPASSIGRRGSSRRHTVLSVVSSEGGGYELQFRVAESSSDEDDYCYNDDDDDDDLSYVEEEEQEGPVKEEVVTWEWIVKDGVAAPAKAPTSSLQVRPRSQRFSRRWWREKNGVVVEEDYNNVVNILRSLR
jgi:hypothetical protein